MGVPSGLVSSFCIAYSRPNGTIAWSKLGLCTHHVTQTHLEHTIAQVTGCSWQKPQLDLTDVEEALIRTFRGFGVAEASLTTVRWSQFPPRIQDIIHAIKSKEEDDDREQRLLDLLIDSERIKKEWSDIFLDPDILEAMKQLISQHKGATKHRPAYGVLKQGNISGALVYGPQGTGKTELARVIASQTDLVVFCVSVADLEDMYVGETQQNIQALFRLAKALAPSLIFVDEADSLFSARTSDDSTWMRSRLDQFLAEMDGLTRPVDNPFVLLSTNGPGDLDTAVLRRVPASIYIRLPPVEARAQIFRIMLRDALLDLDVDIDELAWMTPHFSGSDIGALCIQAALMCTSFIGEQNEHDGKRVLSRTLIERTLGRTNPTVTQSVMRPIAAFAKENDPTAYRKIKMAIRVRYIRNSEKAPLNLFGDEPNHSRIKVDSDSVTTGRYCCGEETGSFTILKC
jgi:SpoVK/Ycf46/Vps4 family AAA+-type ATPase